MNVFDAPLASVMRAVLPFWASAVEWGAIVTLLSWRSEAPEDRHDEGGHDEEPHQEGEAELRVVSELVAAGPHHHQVRGGSHGRQECSGRGHVHAHQHRAW